MGTPRGVRDEILVTVPWLFSPEKNSKLLTKNDFFSSYRNFPVWKKLWLCAWVPPMILPRGSPECWTVPIYWPKNAKSHWPQWWTAKHWNGVGPPSNASTHYTKYLKLQVTQIHFHYENWTLLHRQYTHTVVIISITRYRDIDRRFVERTISWRPHIVRYRARTHVSRVRCSHTAAASSASDWCHSPCTTSVAP